MTKTKIDSVYWYKFGYRYKYYDRLGARREKTERGFDSIEKAERALIEENSKEHYKRCYINVFQQKNTRVLNECFVIF